MSHQRIKTLDHIVDVLVGVGAGTNPKRVGVDRLLQSGELVFENCQIGVDHLRVAIIRAILGCARLPWRGGVFALVFLILWYRVILVLAVLRGCVVLVVIHQRLLVAPRDTTPTDRKQKSGPVPKSPCRSPISVAGLK